MSPPNSADLLRDHAAIDSLSARLSAMLDQGAEPAALALALDQLVATVSDHLALEDEMIYTIALQARSGSDERAVAEMREEYTRLRTQWDDYVVEWKAEAIAANRAAFERATRAMLPRLRDRVGLENQLLFHLSLQRPRAD